METKITEQNDTAVTIQGNVPIDIVLKERASALQQLGKDVKLDGFRPGKIPEKILSEHVDPVTLWKEMATRALSKALPDIIKEHNIDPIGYPDIHVTKLAPDNPLEFTATFSLLPAVSLPDYVAIAKEHATHKKDESVSEKELEDAITNIRKRFAQSEQKEGAEEKDLKLPQLDDAFVQKIGPYQNVDDFRKKLFEQIKTYKQHMAREKNRLAIIEGIVKEANPKVPRVLIDIELDKMLAQMRADIQRAGMDITKYFEQVGKTESDFRKDWEKDAEKRAQIQLVLNEIAKKEDIQADEKEVEAQTKQLLVQHPPAKNDLKRAEVATKIYVATQLTNERVFQFLEEQKQ